MSAREAGLPLGTFEWILVSRRLAGTPSCLFSWTKAPRRSDANFFTCVSASARQSRAQCCAREFCCKMLNAGENSFSSQPVMRQVACSGSLPPRWVTKNFSACGVITTRRARHAPPGQKESSRAAAARPACPCACACASPCSRAAHAHTHALTPLAFATAKQPSTRVSIQEPKGPDSSREPARPPPLAVLQRHSRAVPHIM